MAQRGLENWEIALIKQMMQEQYARDKMHAYFNRPDRTLTPAAFSEIKTGKFGADINAAGSDILARFVERYSRSPDAAASDPMGAQALDRLLTLKEGGTHLFEGENDQIEFKKGFSFADNTFSKIVRAIAALANNVGGYILCGVENSGKVGGLAAVANFDCDLSRWSKTLKSCLVPVPIFERLVIQTASVSIGVIYIEQARCKPIVATKNVGDRVRAGAIYYRYPGESAEIGYGELMIMLQERDRKAQKTILDDLNIFTERQPNELAVVDLRNGQLINGDNRLSLSSEFVKQLSVIREGEFVERGGSPAVRILADATIGSESGSAAQIVRGFVSDSSLVRNFVHQAPVQEPMQYFSAAISSQSDWLPIFRWIDEAGVSLARAAEIVEAEGLSPKKRVRALERLSGQRSVYVAPIPSIKPTVKMLLAGGIPDITTPTELRRLMQAVRSAVPSTSEQRETLWAAVKKGFDFAWAPQNGGDLQSYVKAAAGRLDEFEHSVGIL